MLGCQYLRTAEKLFFKGVNRFLEPTIRAGFVSPWLLPLGFVVMETVGRKSGRVYNIPVMAWSTGDLLIVSTVRGNSQWLRNVAARPEIHVWLRGNRQPCTAMVVSEEGSRERTDVEKGRFVPLLTDVLEAASRLGVASFAILALEPDTMPEEQIASTA